HQYGNGQLTRMVVRGSKGHRHPQGTVLRNMYMCCGLDMAYGLYFIRRISEESALEVEIDLTWSLGFVSVELADSAIYLDNDSSMLGLRLGYEEFLLFLCRPGFYQRNNRNSSYPNRRPSMEESLSKYMAESAKRHEENSNIIKEIRASIDAAIRNQGASIKTLEIQIEQMSKDLQERGFGSLPSSTETNPRDQVKSISTSKADSSEIRHMKYSPYAISSPQHIYIFLKIVPFPR
nr:hypothetical protein [Tanacetum cinerariifolium]